ncbi:MAG: D-glycero-alpha-D-manno-heptose-7-phosphate kinase, partial [Gaiellales bacterium]|nr:D-glycero-alpha-D-manno-heptose-7-phosphate kinase [Gaiellales bacterium]
MLNATIDRYAYGLLRPRKDRQIRIESADFGLSVNYAVDEPPIFDGRLDLVKAAIRRLGDPSSLGYDIFLHSNAPPGSGLGSSSTVMVTLIGLLKEHHKLPLTDYEVAQLSYHIERVDMAMLGGMQDQYAATFGGFNFIEFAADH